MRISLQYVSEFHYWGTADNRQLQRTIKHPVKFHAWGCFSENEFGRLFLFNANLNAVLMNKIYQTHYYRQQWGNVWKN